MRSSLVRKHGMTRSQAVKLIMSKDFEKRDAWMTYDMKTGKYTVTWVKDKDGNSN